MNFKKYFKQQAQKYEEEDPLTEEEKEFCRQLAMDVQPEEQSEVIVLKRPNVKLWSLLSGAAAVCIALAITLPIVLKKPVVDDILYKEGNIKSEACLLSDVNENSNNLQLVERVGNSFNVKLNYDSLSNDKLYYTIKLSSDISEITLFIVVNDKYNFEFELSSDLNTAQLSQYEIKYSSEVVNGLNGTETKYLGYVQVNTETVYIDYTQIFDLEDMSEQAFFDDIQSVLKTK